jgi:cell wall-associated NlpC family hydrolase
MSRTPLPARARTRAARLLATTLITAGSSLAWTVAPADATTAPRMTAQQIAARTAMRAELISDAVEVALRQIGDPYQYGSAGPGRFDCSGLLYFSLHRVGFTGFPRTAAEQSHWGRPISKRDLRRGDLIFFYRGGYVYHAAIFLGWSNGHAVMVHAPEPGTDVRRDHPWTSQWFARTMR